MKRRIGFRIALLLSLSVLFPGACGGGGAGGATDSGGGSADVPAQTDTGTQRDVATGADVAAEETIACTPRCGQRECGDDGCGGSCGSCFDAGGQRAPELCIEGRCCLPDCLGRDCGDDGCGGSCGSCFRSGVLAPDLCRDGQCCTPDCFGNQCGDDGCGGSCGSCGPGLECSEFGRCEPPCEPDCEGRCCGGDGCGGSCEDTCGAELAECDPDSCGCVRRYPICDDAPVVLPDCPALEPAPTTPAGVAAFTRDNALPLYCTSAEGERRSLAALVADAGEARLIMFGEVHGSAELGHVSADLFEALVRAGAVNAVGMEMGFDLTGPMNTYVQTGGGPLVHSYGFDYFPPDLFATTLLRRARALWEEGFAIHAFGVDSPMRLAHVNEELEAIADRLSPEAGALVRELMPEPVELWEMPPGDYAARADAYHEHVVAHQATICEGLAPEDCARIVQLSDAFWIGHTHMSDFDRMSEAELIDFFDRREQLIFAVYRWNFADTERRVYAHMGAAHTCTSGDGDTYGGVNAGGFLQRDYPPTEGRVYSTHVAWGDGSAINYGGIIYDQPAEPALVANAMEDAEGDEYAISLKRPGEGCVTNPLETGLRQVYYFAPYSDCYDTLVYVRQLTPERGHKSASHPIVERLLRRRDIARR